MEQRRRASMSKIIVFLDMVVVMIEIHKKGYKKI